MLTLQALTYIVENDQTSRPIWNYTIETLDPGANAKLKANLSSSAAGKCAPMQIVNQVEHGRALTTEEQKCPSFQMNHYQ